MLFLKVLVAITGTIGLLLAGHLSHSTPGAEPSSGSSRPIEFGGVSAQTATAAVTVDRGTAWYTLHGDGLHRELTSR